MDPDDSLWAVAFPSFTAYQESYVSIQVALGFYEQVYRREFADQIAASQTVIQDIDGVVDRVVNADGSINIKELVYFVGIGLERVAKKSLELRV